MPYPTLPNKGSLPDPPRVCGVVHGISDGQANQLQHMLGCARNWHAAGWTRDEIVLELLANNDQLESPLPAFSPGGLIDSLNGIVGEAPTPHGFGNLVRRRAEGARGYLTLHLTLLDSHGRIPSLLSLCSGCGRVLMNGRVV